MLRKSFYVIVSTTIFVFLSSSKFRKITFFVCCLPFLGILGCWKMGGVLRNYPLNELTKVFGAQDPVLLLSFITLQFSTSRTLFKIVSFYGMNIGSRRSTLSPMFAGARSAKSVLENDCRMCHAAARKTASSVPFVCKMVSRTPKEMYAPDSYNIV